MDTKKKSNGSGPAGSQLIYDGGLKDKLTAELIIANKELAFQNIEKEKRAAELCIANTELAFQNKEKEKRAAELLIANKELQRAEEFQKSNVLALEEMMFMTSHKIRQPIAQILGLSSLIDNVIDSPEELREMISFIKKSAHSLDNLTRELIHFIYEQEAKEKNRR